MALLYPWANKDYLLWNMTIGQIIFYNNIGIELKYGKQEKSSSGLVEKSAEELRKFKEEMKAQYGDI